MNKNNYQWIIGILIILNLLSLSIIWFGHIEKRSKDQFPTENRRIAKERDADFLHKKLDLNKKQSLIFRSLRQIHLNDSRKIQKLIHMKKKQIFKESFALEVNDSTINLRIVELSELQRQIEIINTEHILKMKDIIDPDQVETLEKIFGRMMHRADPENHFRKRPSKIRERAN